MRGDDGMRGEGREGQWLFLTIAVGVLSFTTCNVRFSNTVSHACYADEIKMQILTRSLLLLCYVVY